MIKRFFLVVICLALIFFAKKAISSQTNKLIIINIPSRSLEFIENNRIKYKFPVGVGQPKWPTPVGSFFKVISKVKDPKWQNPYKAFSSHVVNSGNGNPLGKRWIGFYYKDGGEYGMHGTNNPSSVGQYSSHGCVRMHNKDILILFDNIELETPVKVNNFTYKIEFEGEKIFVKKYDSAYKTQTSVYKMINEQVKYFNEEVILDESGLKNVKNLKTDEKVFIGTLK